VFDTAAFNEALTRAARSLTLVQNWTNAIKDQ